MNDKMRIQFVNTATLPPLGADTWIHVQIMRHLDRSTHELHAACASGPADNPTPTYEALRQIPDLELMAVHFGPELSHRSRIDKLKGVLQTLPAAVSVLRLGVHLVRRGIAVIHTSDRPRDALVCVLLGKLTRRPTIVQVHVMFSSWMSPLLRWSLRHADGLIAVSDFVGQSLVAGGVRPDRVHVVLNSIEPSRWEPGRGR
jgi:glycosyltransferase involved in cell wall biosynthesis